MCQICLRICESSQCSFTQSKHVFHYNSIITHGLPFFFIGELNVLNSPYFSWLYQKCFQQHLSLWHYELCVASQLLFLYLKAQIIVLKSNICWCKYGPSQAAARHIYFGTKPLIIPFTNFKTEGLWNQKNLRKGFGFKVKVFSLLILHLVRASSGVRFRLSIGAWLHENLACNFTLQMLQYCRLLSSNWSHLGWTLVIFQVLKSQTFFSFRFLIVRIFCVSLSDVMVSWLFWGFRLLVVHNKWFEDIKSGFGSLWWTVFIIL